MKRPLVVVVLLYVGGIGLAQLFSASWSWLIFVSLGLTLAALVWEKARSVLLTTVLMAVGWTNSELQTAIISPRDLRTLVGDKIDLATVRGTLRETPSQRVYERDDKESWRTMAQVDAREFRLDKQDWQPAFGRVAVTTPGILPAKFFAGQTVEITGILRKPKTAM